jgi:hypothetical protein
MTYSDPLIVSAFGGYIILALVATFALVRHYFKTREGSY